MPDPKLSDVRMAARELDYDAAQRTVKQALLLLEQTYVHRWQKEAMHAIDPVQRLRLLLAELEGITPSDAKMTNLDFHRRMSDIFVSLRDRHTNYLLPEPYVHHVAYLPILIEAVGEVDKLEFLVTRIENAHAEDPHLQKGAEVLSWNGVPIRRAIELLAEKQPAGNPAARLALALRALTVRPLARSLEPDEDWVILGYRDRGAVHETRLDWRVHDLRDGGRPARAASMAVRASASAAVGVDLNGALIFEMRRELFHKTKSPIPTELDGLLRADVVGDSFGYLRIFSFDVANAEGFVDEVARLLQLLQEKAPNGLIIDIRGNPGGNIAAAERILHLLTPRQIKPAPLQFINTPLTLKLCRRHGETDVPGLLLKPWQNSIANSIQTGAQHSAAFAITDEISANEFGQCYYGPVVLITDPFCYSAAEIFAGGFQDHAIGDILAVGGKYTGGGGANVWSHALLTALLAGETGVEPLGDAAGMTVAIRRSLRVGPKNTGEVIEDFGVAANAVYSMSRQDVTGSNDNLIAEAIVRLMRMAKTRPARKLCISKVTRCDGGVTLELDTRNLKRVDLYLDNRPVGAITVTDDHPQPVRALTDGPPARRVRAVGYASMNGSEPVASATARVERAGVPGNVVLAAEQAPK